jgi:hypothetical protein
VKNAFVRVAIVCCHFLRNLAFYRAGWQYDTYLRERSHRTPDQFRVNANSNSLDICVLEWCKLFGEKRTRGKNHWLHVAEGVGFEPTVPVKGRQFSRLEHSTALPPFRQGAHATKNGSPGRPRGG